jgi:S1-C subfamily serine protease
MRSIFTLAGILVTVAVIMWAFSKTAIPTAKQGLKTQDDARQLSGRDTDGTPITETFTLEAQSSNGQVKSLLVTSIVPGTAMERYYGLKKGDQIISIGSTSVEAVGDPAIGLAQQAYQEKQPLVVMRDGKEMTLAGGDTAVPGAPAPANPNAPQAPGGVQLPPGVQVPGNN